MALGELARRRKDMVDKTIASRDVDDPRVLEAMAKVPRHRFVPIDLLSEAYEDRALPIGHDVTISQPYIVALMSALAKIEPGSRVLEIGTGSGYQTAVLAELGAEVYSIERIAAHHTQATEVLAELGYGERVHLRHGDGHEGWPESGPYDAIVLTAAPEAIPKALIEQLAPGGRLVAPVGPRWIQSLVVIERGEDGRPQERYVADVAFVPMVSGLE